MVRRLANRFAILMIVRFLSVLVVAFITTSALAQARPLFLPQVTYDAGGFLPTSVAVGDLNGDGKLDLVVASCEPLGLGACVTNGNVVDGVVSVFLGSGNGTFAGPVNYDSGGEDALSVAIADVNGDGKPDLIVANDVSRESAQQKPC